MSGLMQKYKESLKNTPGPVRLQDLPPMVIDQPGMLSEKEKNVFCPPREHAAGNLIPKM